MVGALDECQQRDNQQSGNTPPKPARGSPPLFLKDIMSYSWLFTVEGLIDPVKVAFDGILEVSERH